MELKNIEELDVHGDDWRIELNGEESKECQVYCDECNAVEEDVSAMYMFHFAHSNFILCDDCLSKMKTTLLQNAV